MRRIKVQRGSVSAELVVAIPLLLLMIMLVVQFALWQHGIHIAQAAADRGVTAARIEGGTASAGTLEAQTVLSQLGQSIVVMPNVQVIRDADTASVVITGSAETVVPGLTLPIRAQASGPVEQFRPASAGP